MKKGEMKRGILSLLLAILTALAFIHPSPVYSQENDKVEYEEVFLVGLIPEENIFRQIKRHKPLEEYLSDKLGIKFDFSILSRYPDIIDRFTQRTMDGAFFGIFTAALAHERLGVEPIARTVNLDGSTTARGCLFVRKDSAIKTAGDMRKKRMAFVDMATATGYLFSIAYLKENGISNVSSYFSETYFTGSHDTAVYTVLSGKADVGVVKCRVLKKLSITDPVIEDEIQIIARSLEMPDNTLCIRSDIPDDLKKNLSSVLLNMHNDPNGKEVLKKLEAQKFVSAGSHEFNPVKELARKAGINIKKYKYR
jgi:phosphonate transport system substrate-binding protein